MSEQLEIQDVEDAKVLKIVNTPELDYFSTASIKGDVARAVAQEPPILIFDLSDVGYLDSTGVGLILATHRSMQRAESHFALVGVNARIMELFRHSHLDRTFKICDTVGQAINQAKW